LRVTVSNTFFDEITSWTAGLYTDTGESNKGKAIGVEKDRPLNCQDQDDRIQNNIDVDDDDDDDDAVKILWSSNRTLLR